MQPALQKFVWDHYRSGETDWLKNQKHFYSYDVKSPLPLDFSSTLPPEAGSSDISDGGCWSFGDHLSWGRQQLARLEDLWDSPSNCGSSVNEMGPKRGLHELCEWSGCSCHVIVTKHFCSAFPGYKCLQGTRRQKRSLDFQKKMSGIGMSAPLGGLKILTGGGKGMCLGSRGQKVMA